MTKLEIMLADTKDQYSPGEFIEGKCVVTVKNKEEVLSLYLEITGHSNVDWTEGSGDDKTSYRSHHTILEFKQIILVTNDASQHAPIILQMGKHEYPFKMTIPFGELPSSFIGLNGTIKYTLMAKIVRNFYPNISEYVNLQIVNPPSSINPSYQFPVEHQNEKTLCCCCCKSGPVVLAVVVNKTAFQLGEVIMVSAEITNYTKRQVTPKAKLFLRTTYIAEGRTHLSGSSLVTIQGPPLRGTSEKWNDQKLPIPMDLKNLSILNCQNIKVEYLVEVSLAIPGSINLKVEVPIILGLPLPYLTDPSQLLHQPGNSQQPFSLPENNSLNPYSLQPHITQPQLQSNFPSSQMIPTINQPLSSLQPSHTFSTSTQPPPYSFTSP